MAERGIVTRMLESRRTTASLLIALATLAGPVSSCSSHYFRVYRSAISKNQQALQRLELGMSPADVERVMGKGEIVRYGRIHLVDPWRSESFRLEDGTKVLILYYVTQPPHRFHSAEDPDTTPIVIEDDELAGWGWSFIERNEERYRLTVSR